MLGVKNRAELAECVEAADAGPLPDDTMAEIAAAVASPRRVDIPEVACPPPPET